MSQAVKKAQFFFLPHTKLYKIQVHFLWQKETERTEWSKISIFSYRKTTELRINSNDGILTELGSGEFGLLKLQFKSKYQKLNKNNKDIPGVWYAQRRCTLRSERNADFGRRAMLLNAQISGIQAATLKLTYTFLVHTAPRNQRSRVRH